MNATNIENGGKANSSIWTFGQVNNIKLYIRVFEMLLTVQQSALSAKSHGRNAFNWCARV